MPEVSAFEPRPLDPAIVGTRFESYDLDYDVRDTIVYALGVGAGRQPEELRYVYEREIMALPTQPLLAASRVFMLMSPALGFGEHTRLHGEQRFRLHRPVPPQGRIRVEARVTAVWDKGAHAIIDTSADFSIDGDLVASAVFSSFIRGGGGFGGERGRGLTVPEVTGPPIMISEATHWNQALLYRLTGDLNPLHIDPSAAQDAGFDRPILHGLCTYGYAVRMAMRALDGLGSAAVRRADARFVRPVFAGDSLRLELWSTGEGSAYGRLLVEEGEHAAIDPLLLEFDH